METGFMNRITGLVIALVVGGLLVGGLLIPTVQGMTEPEKTKINEGANYALYEQGDTHTITFTADSMITDGVAQPLPDTSVYNSATIAYGTGGILRYASDGTIRWYGSISGDGGERNMGTATAITISITDEGLGSAESSGGGAIRTIGTTKMFADPTGNYALSYNPYILENSEMHGAGNTVISSVNYGVYWEGTIDNIIVQGILPADQEFGEVVVNTSNPATNLLKVESVVIPDITADADLTYTYFFAPKEITYDNPLQLDATQIAMFGVISILGIVALVVVAANGIRNKY